MEALEGALVPKSKEYFMQGPHSVAFLEPDRRKNNRGMVILILVFVLQIVVFTGIVVSLHTRIQSLEREATISAKGRAAAEHQVTLLSRQMSATESRLGGLFMSEPVEQPVQPQEFNGTRQGQQSGDENKVHNATIQQQLQGLHQSAISGVAAIHLIGGLPELFFRDKVVSGAIGPWYNDKRDSVPLSSPPDFKLDPSNTSLIILSDGFYFIYAQVYYLSNGGSNSFSIMRRQLTRDNGETLATCSSGFVAPEGKGHIQEVSCFTATVGRLSVGDSINLVERERNRRVLFRDGQTYFGLTKLNPPKYK